MQTDTQPAEPIVRPQAPEPIPDRAARVPNDERTGAAPAISEIAWSDIQNAAREFAQPCRVQQFNLAAIDRDELLLAEAAEHAADGFRGKPQVIGDVGARHAEAALRAGQSARRVTVAEVHQECGKPFVGGMVAG